MSIVNGNLYTTFIRQYYEIISLSLHHGPEHARLLSLQHPQLLLLALQVSLLLLHAQRVAQSRRLQSVQLPLDGLDATRHIADVLLVRHDCLILLGGSGIVRGLPKLLRAVYS